MEQQTAAIKVGSHVRVIPQGLTGRVTEIASDGLIKVVYDNSDTFEWSRYLIEHLEPLIDIPTLLQTVRSLIRQAQHHLECAEAILKKLQEMDAPRLLGFASWEDFCWQNFGHNRQYLYRQLHAAQVRAHLYKHVPEAEVSNLDTLSESVLRQFKVAEQALWVDIYDSAKRIGGGTITAKTVKQASDTYADVLQHGTVDGVPLSEVVAAGAVELMVSRNAANSDLHWVVSRAAVRLKEILRSGDDHYAYLRFDNDLAEKLQNLEGKQVVLSIGVKMELNEYRSLTKVNKYGNKRVRADGHLFDSQAEYRRWKELKMLSAGEISDLVVHPTFAVSPGGRDRFTHKVIRAHKYESDFQYYDKDARRTVVEDVKGVATQLFKLKWDIVRLRYPDIEFRLVKV